jgi:hypothetical protein
MKEIFLSDRINRIPRIFSFFLSFLKEAEKTQQVAFGERHLVSLVVYGVRRLGLLSFFREGRRYSLVNLVDPV